MTTIRESTPNDTKTCNEKKRYWVVSVLAATCWSVPNKPAKYFKKGNPTHKGKLKRVSSIQNEEEYDCFLDAIGSNLGNTWEDETVYAASSETGFYLKQIVQCRRELNGGEQSTFVFHLSMHTSAGKKNRVHVKIFQQISGKNFDVESDFTVVPRSFYKKKQNNYFCFKDELKYNVLSTFPLSVRPKKNTASAWEFDEVIQSIVFGHVRNLKLS